MYVCTYVHVHSYVLYLYAYARSASVLTLDALGEVPEVEDVVRLGWGGQQVSAHAAIDLNTGREDRDGEERRQSICTCTYVHNTYVFYAWYVHVRTYFVIVKSTSTSTI